MKMRRFIYKSIFTITPEELNFLMEKKDKKIGFICEEKQLFICENGKNYIAIDNTTGDLFVESFTIEDDAAIWLLDLKTAEVLHEAEKESYWW